jgi:hypothetical protein
MYFQSNPKREDGKNKNSPFKILSNGNSIQGKEKSPSRDYENSIAQEIPKEMGYILFESLTLPIKNQNKYGTRDVKTEKRLHPRHFNQTQQCGMGHPKSRKILVMSQQGGS